MTGRLGPRRAPATVALFDQCGRCGRPIELVPVDVEGRPSKWLPVDRSAPWLCGATGHRDRCAPLGGAA